MYFKYEFQDLYLYFLFVIYIWEIYIRYLSSSCLFRHVLTYVHIDGLFDKLGSTFPKLFNPVLFNRFPPILDVLCFKPCSNTTSILWHSSETTFSFSVASSDLPPKRTWHDFIAFSRLERSLWRSWDFVFVSFMVCDFYMLQCNFKIIQG